VSTATTSNAGPRADIAAVTAPVDGWREGERFLAQALIVLLGFNRVYRAGATYGEIAALLTIPLWIGSFRRYRLGVGYLSLGLVTIVWGLLLRDFTASDHLVNGALSRDVSVQMLGLVLGVGVVLYARSLLSPPRIALLFGVGMLAAAALNRGAWRDNPWKFALAVPVCLIVLAGAAMLRRLVIQLGALAALALVSVVLDSRAFSATLALAAVLLFWGAARNRSATGLTRLRVAALIAGVAGATYFLATSLLVNGYLGREAQVRTIDQIQTSGSLILGGRPEIAATFALMKHHVTGYGVGVIPTPTDILVAKSGLAGINYAPNNGYVERYMFGGQFELHSVIGDMWAGWGIVGLVLLSLITWIVVRSLVEATSGGPGDVVTIFVCVWTVWNLAFSPLVVSAPIMLLAVGLGLRQSRRYSENVRP
jgi:hypothetical protein